MSHKGLTWKIFGLIVLNDAANSFAQLFMKQGLVAPAGSLDSVHAFLDFAGANIGSPLMWFGIAIYTLSFFAWIIVLSRVELSVALPVASTDYVMIPLLAIIFLKEAVSPLRWIGILTIILGIFCVSQSGTRVPAGGGPV